jgi:hypothetical protein
VNAAREAAPHSARAVATMRLRPVVAKVVRNSARPCWLGAVAEVPSGQSTVTLVAPPPVSTCRRS